MENYKRFKLDKFVSGTEQRIFKTTTKEISVNTNTYEVNLISGLIDKNVYYGEFSTEKRNLNKVNNKDILSGNLIDFHDINADYITNRPDKNYVANLNRSK